MNCSSDRAVCLRLRACKSVFAAGLACFLGVAGLTRADVVILTPSADNTLYWDPSGSLSNGVGVHFFAGNNDIGQTRRGLVRFDVSGIPPGSVVNSVTLTLHMSRTRAGATQVALHRVLRAWGEGASDAEGNEGGGMSSEPGDATWLHCYYPQQAWTNVGGDYFATASASTQVTNSVTFYNWSSPALIADVQAWIDNPAANFGWMVRGNESSSRTTKRFDSRESFDPAVRPKVRIDYTPPSPAGACCINGACTSVTSGDCAAQGGVYLGDGTTCSPDPCGPPTGACCLPDGTCVETTSGECAAQSGTYQGDGMMCEPGTCGPVLTPFVDPLPIPPVATPDSGVPGGAATYTLAMREFEQQVHRDLPPTRLWGFNGSYPGPTIEASSGLPVTVRWVNDLRDESGELRTTHYLPVNLCAHGATDQARTVVHLHGGHVPHEYDGYPEYAYLPGQQATYVYPNLQLPGTLWYHDHAMGLTRLNVYMGLAGMYIVRDAFEETLDLPDGGYEIPLVIQDRTFNSDGTLAYPEMLHDHFFGNTILVNGKVWPYLEVGRGKYRFRVLNGSNARTYALELSTADVFVQIGTEGGLLPAPVLVKELALGPGERADIVIDFEPYAPGTEIMLTNSAPAPYPGDPGVGVIPDVMKFVVTADAGHTAALPSSLRPIEPLLEIEAQRSRDFVLRKQPDDCAGQHWLINDLHWTDVTELPRLNSVEVWSFVNRSGVSHPMHVHLVMFQVLDRQDFEIVNDQVVPVGPRVEPPAGEAGWKDTVMCHPNQITRVITRFTDYTGLFAYHCHILEHEDHAMMRQFRVVGPEVSGGTGKSPVTIRPYP